MAATVLDGFGSAVALRLVTFWWRWTTRPLTSHFCSMDDDGSALPMWLPRATLAADADCPCIETVWVTCDETADPMKLPPMTIRALLGLDFGIWGKGGEETIGR
jgi:hypothetical protein